MARFGPDEAHSRWIAEHPVEPAPPLYEPSDLPPDPETEARLRAITRELRTGARLTQASDVRPARTRWFWPGRIPFGKLTVLDGNPGQGKSTLTMALAAAASTGSPLPGHGVLVDPTSVLVLSAEDGVADTIVPRLLAHGADLEKVHALEAVAGNGYDQPDRPWVLPDDMEILRSVVDEVDAKLVIIDPLMAFLSGNRDAHKDQDVRRALHPLSLLAHDTGAAVMIVRHLNKGAGGLAITRGGGSIGIIGAARAGLIVGVDPNDETTRTRVLAVSKLNLGKPGESLAFHLEPAPEFGCARIAWDGVSAHTAETVLAAVNPEDVLEVGRATEFLKMMLRDGPVPVTRILQKSKQAGITDKFLARARRTMGVQDVMKGDTVNWAHNAWSTSARLVDWETDAPLEA